MNEDDDELIPDPKVAKRFNVHPITIRRWEENPKLGFPEAVRINNRKYRRRRELVAWERSRAAGRAA
jgi:DNA-binding transcriptional MerR regulator